MKVIVAKDYNEMSKKAAELIINKIKEKDNLVLGLATGSTPIGIYENLIKANKNKEISFKNVKTVNLDEYIGLDSSHDQSYRYFMNDKLFNHIDIDKENTFFPDGTKKDMQEECLRYTELLKSTVQDIQLLGLGANGHIGFNEPGTSFDSTTHVVALKEQTINDNARFFDSIDMVPKTAVTMGIADIMRSKSIILVASATNKSQAVYAMLKEEMTTECPASALKSHPDVTVIVDEEAYSLC